MTAGGSGALGAGRRSHADRLADHTQVVAALAKRDIQSRFGQNALGYGWTYVTPLVWIAATYFAFWFFGRTSPVYTDIITFIISGLIPYLGFRQVITAIGRVNGGLRGLVIFPSVTLEHGATAMALVEFVNVFIVFAVVAAINYLLFRNGELDNPLMFVGGVALGWGLGAAYAYLFSALAVIEPTFQQLAGTLLRPSYFISGIFFTANELPADILKIFALNPILHAVEFARDGMLFHYQSRVASPLYVLGWIAALLVAGAAVRQLRRA